MSLDKIVCPLSTLWTLADTLNTSLINLYGGRMSLDKIICPHCKSQAEPKLTESGEFFKATCLSCNKFIAFMLKTSELEAVMLRQRAEQTPKGGL